MSSDAVADDQPREAPGRGLLDDLRPCPARPPRGCRPASRCPTACSRSILRAAAPRPRCRRRGCRSAGRRRGPRGPARSVWPPVGSPDDLEARRARGPKRSWMTWMCGPTMVTVAPGWPQSARTGEKPTSSASMPNLRAGLAGRCRPPARSGRPARCRPRPRAPCRRARAGSRGTSAERTASRTGSRRNGSGIGVTSRTR